MKKNIKLKVGDIFRMVGSINGWCVIIRIYKNTLTNCLYAEYEYYSGGVKCGILTSSVSEIGKSTKFPNAKLIRLNKRYTAVINNGVCHIGCQKFSKEKIKQVLKLMR